MPSVKRQTEEPLVETSSPEDEARAAQLAQSWQLSQAPRDLWPELEKLLPTATDDVIEAAKQAQSLGLPFVDLAQYAPEPTALACLSGELARKRRAIPVRKDGNRLFVAMLDPRDIQAIDAFRMHSRLMVQPLVAAPSQIEIALEEFYPETAPSGDRGAIPPIPPTAVGASSSDDESENEWSTAAYLRLCGDGADLLAHLAGQRRSGATTNGKQPPVAHAPVGGEQTDFATFQKVYERRVYRRAAALCGDPDMAQTLTLDVFTHAWRVWNDLPPGTRNWAWLSALTDRLHAESQRALPVDLSPVLAELRAIRGELAGLREENAALRALLQP